MSLGWCIDQMSCEFWGHNDPIKVAASIFSRHGRNLNMDSRSFPLLPETSNTTWELGFVPRILRGIFVCLPIRSKEYSMGFPAVLLVKDLVWTIPPLHLHRPWHPIPWQICKHDVDFCMRNTGELNKLAQAYLAGSANAKYISRFLNWTN